MKCSCCGKKKKLFESFEDLGKGGNVCVSCSDIMYRIHDAVTSNNKADYQNNKILIDNLIQNKKASKDFEIWFRTDFMTRNQINS